MQTAVLGARLLLAVVFLAAGIGKLLDRGGSARALSEFGVPKRLTAVGALALPLAELATAVALVPRPSARGGGIAAAVLLVAFTAAIANALAHKRAPDCHCFGQIHSAPAGAGTLARNGILLALASLVALQGPGPTVGAWVSSRTPGQLALGAAALAALALLISGTDYLFDRRAYKHALARQDELALRTGLPVGSRAPQFELPGACGPGLGLDALRARGKPVMVVFADRSCCACQQLLQEIGRWQRTLASELTVAVITAEDPSSGRELCDRFGIADVLLQRGYAVLDDYHMPATPSAVIVDTNGVVTTATATGYRMIHTLVRLTLRRARTRPDLWEVSTQPV